MPDYKTWLFDCDGVLLKSNAAKSEAFYRAALPYGKAAARQLVAHHQAAGGTSRRAQLEYFFWNILGESVVDGKIDALKAEVDRLAWELVRRAAWMPGLNKFLDGIEGRKLVVSGTETAELRQILVAQSLRKRFDGIFGGPLDKFSIFQDLWAMGMIERPAVYFGDTPYDYQAATAAGLDFVFVWGDSEWRGWREYFADKPEVRVSRDFLAWETPA